MRLSDLKPGQTAVITKILGHGAFRKRVMEMGFVRGREVTQILNAPLQDPVKYALMDYEVSLRRNEARLIEAVTLEEWQQEEHENLTHVRTGEHDAPEDRKIPEERIINVALVGNPNCGKTSLFNIVSGAHERVGNYAGVTVDAKQGTLKYKGYKFNVVDLPGTYSLSAYSPEEIYVTRYLSEETPDVIVNVAVASNLERNLYLTTELIDMNRSMVIALNMFDELEKSEAVLDYKHLGAMLGVPIVPTVASTGRGVEDLLDTIIEVFEMRNQDARHIHVVCCPEVEDAIRKVKEAIKADPSVSHHFSPRYVAIKLLEGDPEMTKVISGCDHGSEILDICRKCAARLKEDLEEDPQTIIASQKYGFIQGALAETLQGNVQHDEKTTKIIDALVTSRLFGFPLFFGVMLLMFWATFQLGAYPMEWIESLVEWISGLVGEWMPEGPLKDLVLNGIIGGVGGVIVFLPNILILYAFISFMEDSGYMARVAFIMDRMMHKMGLHGKSFIPLVMGFGCNVPAIMSTRIIESKSSRLITILVNPFMSCSARIPIYVLLAGAFFPKHGTLVFFGLYLLGIVIAVITARLLRRLWFKKDETPFVMELPPYRMPTAKATVRNMWAKARQYLQKMGGLILVASIIIWALSYFPHYEENEIPQEALTEIIENMPESTVASHSEAEITELAAAQYGQNHSYLAHIGQFLEPVVRPLDFDWKVGVSLLAGASAKEVVVSTLGVLYVGDDDADALSERLKTPSKVTGKAPFTTSTALAFMVFVLLYFPCIATLAAVIRETGSWKYGLFSLCYNTALAWCLAWVTLQVANLFC